mmetsp:Transcript_8735/g.18346  ORF Transcript_8735/g.18346 Transcript_8735/m.18346 type:complete len:423 (-) Transcript_8735:69-1337(-)
MITKVDQWLQPLFLLTMLASWDRSLSYTSSSNPIKSRRSNVESKSSAERDSLSRRRGPSALPERSTQHLSPLSPPFPNGQCGGTVITLPAEEMYSTKGDGLLSVLSLPATVSNFMLTPRDISVWLPKEYDFVEFKRVDFPVLYCHDGQNAYEDSSSWTGSSWRMIGALTRLYERDMIEIPPIVVMIPSADGDIMPGLRRRHAEYGDMTLPFSQAHGEFVAEKLHPYVKNRFRVKDGPENVSAIGSSLGGQASLQLVLRYPETFGGVACMSPCFQVGTIASVMANVVNGGFDTNSTGENLRDLSVILSKASNLYSSKEKLRNNHKSLHSKTIYIDNGGDRDESKVPFFDVMDHFTMNDKWWNPGYFWLDTQLQPTIDAVRWALDRGGVEYWYEKFPGARHNERAWAQRIHSPLLTLYGKTRQP